MAKQLVKVHFELDSKDWHGHGGDFLWAAPTGDSAQNEFRILNSPYFTRGIGFNDVVIAAASDDKNVFEFESVVERSGHSTYMLIIEENATKFGMYWKMLEEKGCSYEQMQIKLSIGRCQLLSVDVPPTANIYDVYDILEKGESVGAWRFQEGHAHLPKN